MDTTTLLSNLQKYASDAANLSKNDIIDYLSVKQRELGEVYGENKDVIAIQLEVAKKTATDATTQALEKADSARKIVQEQAYVATDKAISIASDLKTKGSEQAVVAGEKVEEYKKLASETISTYQNTAQDRFLDLTAAIASTIPPPADSKQNPSSPSSSTTTTTTPIAATPVAASPTSAKAN